MTILGCFEVGFGRAARASDHDPGAVVYFCESPRCCEDLRLEAA
jgi:hypothetical protein